MTLSRRDLTAAGAGKFRVPDHALDLRGVPETAEFEQFVAGFEAVASDEPLFAVIDRPPRPLVTALADRTDCDRDLDVETVRRGPEAWAVRVERPTGGDCSCGARGASSD